MAAELQVSSAGLQAGTGGVAHPRAVVRARHWRIDLSQHRTTPVNQEVLASADVVLVMELDHIVAIRRRYGRFRRKTFLLTCLAPDAPLEVADPYAGDDAAFDAAFQHIVRAVTPMVDVLRAARKRV